MATVSHYRHTNCVLSTEDTHLLNLSPSNALWDGSNTIACNELFVAIPWLNCGGAVVFQHGDHGLAATNPPTVHGQGGSIIDVAFNPFHKEQLFTASEDGSIFGWQIPAEGLKENLTEPFVRLEGHLKKCGIIRFHPSANGVLASASLDKVVDLWDVEKATVATELTCHKDYVTGLDWNVDGSLLCSSTRDKKVNIIDPRKGGFVSTAEGHQNARSQKCVWAKRLDNILTFGWDFMQRREIMVWDPRNMKTAIHTTCTDQSSAAPMPVFDEDLNLLSVASRGEGRVRNYELIGGALVHSFDFSSSESVKGYCSFPKRSLNVKECEISRCYVLGQRKLFSARMLLPRKMAAEEFQENVYPPTFADKPAISAKDYFDSKKNARPLEVNMKYLFDGSAPPTAATSAKEHVKNTAPAVSAPSREEVKKPHVHEKEKLTSTAAGRVHVDPSTPKEADVKKHATLRSLCAKLESQRAELEKLRAETRKKEDEVMKTIEELQNLAL
ncbi:coronin-1C [Strigomonas culicis]|uniref:Coronin n=1 Tax=Strigomonas culicis TaxID=28005 RepID=S9U461_9TRYP|nr:coronin-1C [Strigomonas culicis]|eukprot:EPY25557.1 coronin-1C [Strigomonas culicis]